MPWAYAGSRLAVVLRRWRGHFGISAPQVAVRTHVPLHLRAFGIGVFIVLLLILAAWVFDFGQQFAGFNQSEVKTLQTANAALGEENARLRGLLAASENDLQIERAAEKELAEKYRVLMGENARLKEELAVLERLAKTKKK